MRLSEALTKTHDSRWAGTKDEEKTYARASRVVEILGDPDVASVTSATADTLVATLKADGASNSTANRYLATLRAMMRQAVKSGAIQSVPLIEGRKEGEARSRYLTRDEERELFDHLPPHFRDLAVFLVDTGLRCGEAFGLKWEQVEDDAILVRHTKTAKPRRVPLSRRAQEVLERRRGEFTGPFTGLTPQNFGIYFRRARAACEWARGDKEIVPHILRHTCASRLVAAGVSLYVVKEWLGHSSIKTTERYAHLDDSALVKALGQLEAG